MPIRFNIKSWYPRKDPEFKVDENGTVQAKIITYGGIVEYFSFAGDERNRPFTHVSMYVKWKRYESTINRYYHRNWAKRIAHEFAGWCSELESQ